MAAIVATLTIPISDGTAVSEVAKAVDFIRAGVHNVVKQVPAAVWSGKTGLPAVRVELDLDK
jgi:hypothetical protein